MAKKKKKQPKKTLTSGTLADVAKRIMEAESRKSPLLRTVR